MLKKLSDLTESDLLELDLIKSNNSVGRSWMIGCTFLRHIKYQWIYLTDYNVNTDNALFVDDCFSIFSRGEIKYEEVFSFTEIEKLIDFRNIIDRFVFNYVCEAPCNPN